MVYKINKINNKRMWNKYEWYMPTILWNVTTYVGYDYGYFINGHRIYDCQSVLHKSKIIEIYNI